MEKLELLYSGKAKKLYRTSEPDQLWVEYLDQATALNGKRKDTIVGKASLNNQITSAIFTFLNEQHFPTHFIRPLSKVEQLVKSVTIIPLEVVLRNVAAGSFSKRLRVAEGTSLNHPIIEFYYKSDSLDDPFINEDHIQFLQLASNKDIQQIKTLTLAINRSLQQYFSTLSINLIDFKLEFGRTSNGTILLADEISPDTCRLWDLTTNERLDKDVYRQQSNDLVSVYQIVLDRIKANQLSHSS